MKHCKFKAAYTGCLRTDLNVDGFCSVHALVKCHECGEQAAGQCETGTFAICGRDLCESKKCYKKHYKRDHPDGRLM